MRAVDDQRLARPHFVKRITGWKAKPGFLWCCCGFPLPACSPSGLEFLVSSNSSNTFSLRKTLVNQWLGVGQVQGFGIVRRKFGSVAEWTRGLGCKLAGPCGCGFGILCRCRRAGPPDLGLAMARTSRDAAGRRQWPSIHPQVRVFGSEPPCGRHGLRAFQVRVFGIPSAGVPLISGESRFHLKKGLR
jgi:hypothetical protein